MFEKDFINLLSGLPFLFPVIGFVLCNVKNYNSEYILYEYQNVKPITISSTAIILADA